MYDHPTFAFGYLRGAYVQSLPGCSGGRPPIGAAAPANAGPPSATTSPASSIGTTTATLNGSGNPNGDGDDRLVPLRHDQPRHLQRHVRHARAHRAAALRSARAARRCAYSQAITGLIPGDDATTSARSPSNAAGTAFGAVLSFTTRRRSDGDHRRAATSITATTATLNGSANPNGAATTGWFRYATTRPRHLQRHASARAPRRAAAPSLGSGTRPVAYSPGDRRPRRRRRPTTSAPSPRTRAGRRSARCCRSPRRRRADGDHRAPRRCHRAPRRRSTASANPNGDATDRLVPLRHREPRHLQRHASARARPSTRRLRARRRQRGR